MANLEHIEQLRQGVEKWNQWRRKNPKIKPDLRGTNLTNLSGGNLRGTNFTYTNLCDAFLRDSDLSGSSFNYADLSLTDLCKANLTGANFHNANVSETNLSGAILRFAVFNGADLSQSNFSQSNFTYADLSESNLSGADLTDANLSDTDLSNASLHGANLSNANLSNANLSNVNLIGASLNGADLSRVNLRGANLTIAQALGTNLRSATLTGICIDNWHIDSRANLQEVICEYIFRKYDWNTAQPTERIPQDSSRIFDPGEFTKRYQVVLDTVDLFFNNGIDWKAFLASLQDLQTQYGNEVSIQGIEKKAGGTFLVRLEVSSNVEKGEIERKAKAFYETQLQIVETQYRNELQAKDREIEIYKQKSADILELAKLAASRPVTVENQVVVENQGHSETFNNYMQGATIGNFANTMKDQSLQHTTQYIGATLNEITTLIHSLRGIAQSFPDAQRTEALDHLEDLETDIQQPPEKRKVSRMKAALAMLLGLATALSGAVAGTNEFVGQLQELSDKLGIPLPIEQVQPQAQQMDAIEVQAVGSEEP